VDTGSSKEGRSNGFLSLKTPLISTKTLGWVETQTSQMKLLYRQSHNLTTSLLFTAVTVVAVL
jgi:hypothetical protein